MKDQSGSSTPASARHTGERERPGPLSRLGTLLQYLLPQHLISRFMYRLMQVRVRWIKNLLIGFVRRAYQVDMTLAQAPEADAYANFNEFFTRTLRPEARPIAGAGQLACPSDGTISAIGGIEEDRLLQAKGHWFGLKALLAGRDELARLFFNGSFATIYLSPRDYHRVHMPLDGRLTEVIQVPGRLFSVNDRTTQQVPGLFARNERVISLFDTEVGPMAVILVGAICVGSIETVWAGQLSPPYPAKVRTWYYGKAGETAPTLSKGQELGRFNMGSTVIVLLPHAGVTWLPDMGAERQVCMGEGLGTCHGKSSL